MKFRCLCAASGLLFGFCASSLVAQTLVDARGPISIQKVSTIDVGDGQSIRREEILLNGQVIAMLQIEPSGSSPLAPAPAVHEESRVEWVVVSATLTSDNRLVARCELRDNGRVVAVMNVDENGIAVVRWTTASIDPCYSLAINTFRGSVRGYALGLVAFNDHLNVPTTVRVRFPDAVLDGREGALGLPSIR